MQSICENAKTWWCSARHGILAIVVLAFAFPINAQSRPVLISATSISGAPQGAGAYRIRYRSIDLNGAPIEITGVVIVPAGRAPDGGRDVVAWAHGSSGVAESCAPSTSAQPFANIAGLETLLTRGYVVTATDYQGLGAPGPHPYLVGVSAGRSVIDSVRAAQDLPRAAASRRYVVWGESQGAHAALWTGQIADRYAPELKLLGVVAAAPPTDLKANLTGGSNAAVRAFLTAYTAASWSRVYGVPLSTITGPVGKDLIERLARNCVSLDGFKLRTKIGLLRLTHQLRGVNLGASPRWAELMQRNSVKPTGLNVPVLIAQGTADPIVGPAVTRAFVDKLCRGGGRVRFVSIDGGDHVTVAQRSSATTVDWIGDRFAGRVPPDDCRRLSQ